MTLGSRGQLHVSRPTCLFTCFKISSSKFTSHWIYSEHTFCAKHMTFKKYFPNTFMIPSQVGTVQEGYDCMVSYTQEQVCHLSNCR